MMSRVGVHAKWGANLLTALLVLASAIVGVVHAATILDIAESLPQFSTLVAAASQAGIAPFLAASGVKTVFAPTNDAFAKLGNNTAAWILNPHNQQHLLSTLYYHIVSGARTVSTFTGDANIPTLDQDNGQPLTVLVSKQTPSSRVTVNNIPVVQSDVVASNGVIQVVNSVLVPGNIGLPANDIVQTALKVPALSTLVTAVKAAGLVGALSQPNGPYVVFAPTDAAFAAVPAKVLNCLLNNVAALQQVLLFHVVSGLVYSEQIASGLRVQTLAGKPVTLNVNGAVVSVNFGSGEAKVVIPNVDTSNGVVHVIDTVLFDNTGPCAGL